MKTLEMEIPPQDSFLQFSEGGSAEGASVWLLSIVQVSLTSSIFSLPSSQVKGVS